MVLLVIRYAPMRRGGGENLDGGGVENLDGGGIDLDGGARRQSGGRRRRLDGGGVDLEMRRRGGNGMRPRLGAAARLNLGRCCNGDGLKIQLPLPPVHLDRPISDGRLSFFVGTVLV